MAALADFYGSRLAFPHVTAAGTRVEVPVGESTLEFVAGHGRPFYHFALLVPGDRFDRALSWIRARIPLLGHAQTGQQVFDFPAWSARACYFHDPADNIVELIAHGGIAEYGDRDEFTAPEHGDRDAFAAPELVGISEVGLVGDPNAMAQRLRHELGLELWDGAVDDPRAVGFVGERARTLIVVAAGRGWLPTGRPAEVHGLEAVMSGSPRGQSMLQDACYRIARTG